MFLDQLPKGLAGNVVPEVARFEDRAIRGPPCCEQILAGFITFLGHFVARFVLYSAVRSNVRSGEDAYPIAGGKSGDRVAR